MPRSDSAYTYTRENVGEDADRGDKFCILYCAYNATARAKIVDCIGWLLLCGMSMRNAPGRHIIRQWLRLHIIYRKIRCTWAGEGEAGERERKRHRICCRNRRVTGSLRAIILISWQNGLLLLKMAYVRNFHLFRNSTRAEYEAGRFIKYG